MKTYILFIQWSNRTLRVSKQFKTKRDAVKWARLCLDICGKNEHGETYNASWLLTK